MSQLVPTRDSRIWIRKGARKDVYIYRGTVNGFRIDKITLEGSSLSEAKESAMALEDDYNNRSIDPKNRTALVKDVYQVFFRIQEDRFKDDDITWEYLEEIRMMFDVHLLPFFGDKRMKQLNDLDSLWVDFKKTVKRKTFDHIRRIFKLFLNWAKRKRYIDYVAELPIPKHTPRTGLALSLDNLNKVYAKITNQDIRDFLLLAASTGNRKMEWLGMTWDRVNIEKALVLTKAVQRRTKKRLWKPISPALVTLLKRRLEAGKGSPFVFPNAREPMLRHRNPSDFNKRWRQAVKDAELKDENDKAITNVTIHDLRHTWAELARRTSTASIEDRAGFLGHSKEMHEGVYGDKNPMLSAEKLRPLATLIPVKEIIGTNVGQIIPMRMSKKRKEAELLKQMVTTARIELATPSLGNQLEFNLE